MHLVAGDPQTLEAIQVNAQKDGARLTVGFARHFVRQRQKQASQRHGREKNGKRNPAREIALETFRKATAQVRSIDEHLKPHFTHVKHSDAEVCDLIEAVAELQANLAPLDELLEAAE